MDGSGRFRPTAARSVLRLSGNREPQVGLATRSQGAYEGHHLIPVGRQLVVDGPV